MVNLRRLLAIAVECPREDVHGNPEIAWAYNELGELAHGCGQVEVAEQSFIRAIEILERVENLSPLDLEVPIKNLVSVTV